MTCQMFPTSGSLRLFTSFLSCSWSLVSYVSCCCRVLDLRRSRQHSASHLSDRCLPTKQWIIIVLHLSGGTHLVWSTAFFLLFLVMAWHPQPAYPAPFFWAWNADALSLSGSVCVSLFLFLTLLFFPSTSLSPSSLPLLLADQVTWIKQTSRLCERREGKKKGKGCFVTRGIRGEVIYLPLFWRLTKCLPSSWCGILPSSLFSILRCLFTSGSQLLCLVC